MLQTIIELSDGTRIGAGTAGTAVMEATLTQSVNAGTELTLGSVCAAMAEVTLYAPNGCPLGPGDSFSFYKRSVSGQLHKLGQFIAERPQWLSGHRVRITAYDAVTRLDKDLTAWLAALDCWPYTLQELAQLVCAACGVTFGDESLPNGSFSVERFSASQVTGRDILGWIAQAAGRFCTADEEGVLHFGWYEKAPVSIGPQEEFGITVTDDGGHLTLSGDLTATDCLTLTGAVGATDDDSGNVTLWGADRRWYRQGSLQAQDYATAPVTAVWIRADGEDTGALYPDGCRENVYVIQGNPLLTGDAAALSQVAQTVWEGLQDFTHTPMTVTVPADPRFRAGQLVDLTDSRGKTVTLCIMSREQTAGTDRLTGTGSATLTGTTAMNERSYKALSGQVLHLRTDIDGIRADHTDLQGKVGSLELSSSGILAQVRQQTQTLEELKSSTAQLQISSGAITAAVEAIEENGVSRVCNEFGLTIDGSDVTIHRDGSEMTNRLNELGMYVIRGQGENETTMLRADAAGVTATDVSVRNYLSLGRYARLEDYADDTDGKRTACYWREDT